MFANRAKNREADGMVAANAQGTRSSRQNRREPAFHAAKRIFDAQRIHREISEVRNAILGERIQTQHRIPGANDRRLIAHTSWAESRAGAIRSSAIKRNTDDRDVQLFGLRNVGQPHEGGDAREPSIFQSVDRLGMG